MLREFPSEGGT